MKPFFTFKKIFIIVALALSFLPVFSFAQNPGGTFGTTGGTGVNSATPFPMGPPAPAPTINVVACPKNFSDIPKVIDYITCTISRSFIPLIFALALLVFFWGVMKYVISPDGSEDRESGRWFMIYGIIGLFVMVSIWGLVAIFTNTFEITSVTPQFPNNP